MEHSTENGMRINMGDLARLVPIFRRVGCPVVELHGVQLVPVGLVGGTVVFDPLRVSYEG